MKLRTLLLLSALALGALASAQTVVTTAAHNGHTYSLLTTSNWTDAEATAVSLGGHLATVEDQGENDWLFDTFGSYGGVNRNLWIGLNDAALEGTFVWSSGSTSDFRNWNPGQPDNYPNSPAGEDYVELFAPVTGYTPGRWNDAPDDANPYFSGPIYGVAEVEAVPEPAPFAALALGALALVRRRRARQAIA